MAGDNFGPRRLGRGCTKAVVVKQLAFVSNHASTANHAFCEAH